MKELGKLKYFLRIEVVYFKQGSMYLISSKKQENWDVRPQGYLLSRTIGLSSNHREVPILNISGKLIYLSFTRPDITYVVSVAVERILQYLKASLGKGLLFRKKGMLSMEICTYADYAGSVVDRRFTFGYCMFLGENLVTWKSKKKNVIAQSSAEVEFRVMAQGICEGLWMKIILDYLKVKYEGPIKLLCDNNSIISAHNLVQHDKEKHIEINRHFIKEKLNSGFVVTTHVPTRFQVANIFTKGFPVARFQELNGKLGIIDIHLPS
ncbi:Copia protein, partial [Mucuna pruriens]